MNRMKELRNSQNKTLKEVAEALDMSPQILSRYELGRREADYSTLSKIADYFRVTIDYLLNRSDSPSGNDFLQFNTAYRNTIIAYDISGDKRVYSFSQNDFDIVSRICESLNNKN